ncbi:MAG: ABC-F family ATP-binding cassette domain-containing protein [Paenibacillaceae bacterium]
MNILNAEQLSKSFGVKQLFDQISFGISTGDRIGLIGINGTGKSTLLKVIAGLVPADQGNITMMNGISIEYLAQNPPFDPDVTILEQIFLSNSSVMKLIQEYEHILSVLSADPENPNSQRHLHEVSARMDIADAWQLESEAKRILSKLGIDEYNARMGDLSGGQKKRVLLAGVLIRQADLLILDEPTNHLDTQAVEWLEQHLSRSSQALLMITHDRYFLDRVSNRILELDQGSLYDYNGNYTYFLDKRMERLQQQQATENKRQNLFRNELEWIRRGAKARSTKQKARIDRFEKIQSAKPSTINSDIDMNLSGSRLGKKVIELNHVSKFYQSQDQDQVKAVVKDFSYVVQKNDRIGIIGPNGSGKSTLLRMVAGLLLPDAGTIETGTTVKIGFFSQENDEMNPALRAIEYIKEVADHIRTADGSLISASQMLELFLFPPDVQWSTISKLSGGEQRRLFLLRILMDSPNVLLLDEPTNDLDIQTLSILEAYLDDFHGAVIVVSHDRYFLDRVAETILSYEGQGKIQHHVGNYSEYLDVLKLRELNNMVSINKQILDKSNVNQLNLSVPAPEPTKRKNLKFSFKEQQEYEQIDSRIVEAEQELEKLNESINRVGADYEQLQILTQEQLILIAKLDLLMERWTYLTELAEEIEQQKTK